MTPPVISPTGGWVGTVIFVLLFLGALVLFGIRVGELITLLVKARREDRTDHIDDRIGEFFLVVLGQSGVLRDPIPGIAHFFTFWGFIVIQFGLLNLILGAFNLTSPFIGDNHTFAIVLDAFIVLVFFALLLFAFRRAVIHPKQLFSILHGPWDGYIILGLIFAVIVTLALVEGFQYAAYAAAHGVAAANNSGAWTPIGTWLYPLFSGLDANTATILYRAFWWLHISTVLFFLIYLPRSKHLHLMATPFNVFFRSYGPKGALPLLENIEERDDYGVSKPEQFTWKQLLDGYACTECGRCNTVCPATNTGKPLFPKEIILGVKEALFVQSDEILGVNSLYSRLGVAGVRADKTKEEAEAHHEPMVGGIISNDALWACTTCRACMEICPVSIEHVPKIVDMRRHLVMEESDFPSEVTSLFNNIEVLDGYGSNTSTNHHGSRHNGHSNGSTTVAAKHRTIITACPHCFNTIRNEYPQLGGNYEVVHHTVFIDKLLNDEKIKLPAGFDQRKLTYHDPCYIGRYNDVYDEPRHVLNVLNSNGVKEMKHHRNKSFCCGGGGGRAWMEEKIGKRVNQTRVNEALETGADVLAAACPFCITMFDDGLKGVEAEDKMKIEDISEIVAQAIE